MGTTLADARKRARGTLLACHHKERTVILEIADIRIHPGQQAAFEAAIQKGLDSVVSRAQGFKGAKVNHGIESPERYVLQIFWDTLEDHTVAFRQGPLFTEWRAIVGSYFAAPPVVEHFNLVTKSGLHA
jgi:heme-degrading monooxygenase HmoA